MLPGIESTLDEEYDQQDYCQRKIRSCGRVPQRFPANENKDSTKQQDGPKSFKEIAGDVP